jgi:hypothetical protein
VKRTKKKARRKQVFRRNEGGKEECEENIVRDERKMERCY